MRRRQFLATASLALGASVAHGQALDPAAVVRHHAALVHANYADVLAAAQDLQAQVRTFIGSPGEATLAAAPVTRRQCAWNAG